MWDLTGVLGTGQSLSVGAPPALSGEQPYGNLMLSLGARRNASVPPWDADSPELSLVPLREPLRDYSTGYPAPYPGNIYGETPHTAMANQLSELSRTHFAREFVTVHSVVGESGQGIEALRKRIGDDTGITGRAYSASLFEVRAIQRLAKARGLTYGVAAIVMTHGETDALNETYEAELIRLAHDYNEDLRALTGQSRPIPMFLSQQHGVPLLHEGFARRPRVNQVQWQLALTRPQQFVCVGPKYQYPGDPSGDGVHLSAEGYRRFGEKLAQVFFEHIVCGRGFEPLHPLSVGRDGNSVVVRFHVPTPPLVWDASFDEPAIDAWKCGRGFELFSGERRLVISSVNIEGDSVRITSAESLPSELSVGYALANQGVHLSSHSNALRWGQLRDSDAFVGVASRAQHPNHAVSFELSVP